MADHATGEKFRLRFEKTGNLRLLSHHDLMRCAERMLRRADLPFRSTAGFHPQPRFVFSLSLPLGVAGLREVAELELLRPLTATNVLDRLNQQSPDGLRFLECRIVPMSASAVPRRAVYTLELPPARVDEATASCERLMQLDKLWIDKYHPRPRQVNVRPYLRELRVNGSILMLDFWVTGQGTARAEELLKELGLADLLTAGFVLARAVLELRDETPADVPDQPPDGPPETAPLNHTPATVAAGDEDDSAMRSATWGLSPNGPVVE